MKEFCFNKLILSILIFTILGCQNENQSANEDNPTIAVVLCDVSKTVENQHDLLFGYIKRIPFCLKQDSQIYYLPISENSSQHPCNSGNPIILPLLTDADDNEGERNRVNKELENVISELKFFSKNNGEWTCILTSILNAFGILNEKSLKYSSKYNFELIIFSDMKESCNSTPIGKDGIKVEMGYQINIKNENHANLDTAVSILKNYVPKNIDFDKNHIKITIISTSSGQTSSYGQKISDIWNELFKKMNYNNTVNITSNFPYTER